ncbi:uncharacterized protein LOC109852128 isoform X2 [Pseudomyrmex gracilis]|uniref:uncharacterized protein LOC109852128 isoform X2 n=1 Tax=Pseudomyrmex gracilis TaxID=219809 RepID=UPI000995417B|nr:uncharacterized protein LOC109852128 isoform X2 [Pseudomyrmex gracilis]
MAAPQASSRLEMLQARFQQKQLQEKEQKLLQLYDQQQQRAYQVVQKGSAGSNGSNHGSTVRTTTTTHTTSTSQGGKVRQMFDERRQTTVKGIDRSYPLEPLENRLRRQANGNVTTQRNGNSTTVNRQSVSVRRVARADVNSNVNGGKPVVTYHEEIARESFGPSARRHDDVDEFDVENRVSTFANGHYRHDDNEHEDVLDHDTIDRNRMMAKIHLMGFDETLKNRVRNDLESEEFPDYLMVDVPEKLPKRNVTKKLSQAEARLERFKNANAKRSNMTKQSNPTSTVIKKRSEQIVPARSNSGRIAGIFTSGGAGSARFTELNQRTLGNRKTPLPLKSVKSRVADDIYKKRMENNPDVEILDRRGDSPRSFSGGWRSFAKPESTSWTYHPGSNDFKSPGDGKIFAKPDASPRFFCKESEKSATTMSIEPRSDSPLFYRQTTERPSFFLHESERRRSGTILGESYSPNRISSRQSSSSPLYPFRESKRYETTLNAAREATGPKSVERRNTAPQFYCKESERSATTMSIDRKVSESKSHDRAPKREGTSPGEIFNERRSAKLPKNVARREYDESSGIARGTSPQFFCKESEKSATTMLIEPRRRSSPTRSILKQRNYASPHFFYEQSLSSNKKASSDHRSRHEVKTIAKGNEIPDAVTQTRRSSKISETSASTSSIASLKYGLEFDNILQSAGLVRKFIRSQRDAERRDARRSPTKRDIKNVNASRNNKSKIGFDTWSLSRKARSPILAESKTRFTPESPRKSVTPIEVDMEIQEITMTDHRIESDRFRGATTPKRQNNGTYTKPIVGDRTKSKSWITYPIVRKTHKQRTSILDSDVFKSRRDFSGKGHRRDDEDNAVGFSTGSSRRANRREEMRFDRPRSLRSAQLTRYTPKDKTSLTKNEHARGEDVNKIVTSNEVNDKINVKYQTIVESALGGKIKGGKDIRSLGRIADRGGSSRKPIRTPMKSSTSTRDTISLKRGCGEQHDAKPRVSLRVSKKTEISRGVNVPRSSSRKITPKWDRYSKCLSPIARKSTTRSFDEGTGRAIEKSTDAERKALTRREDKCEHDLRRMDSVESALRRFDSIGAESEFPSDRTSSAISLRMMDAKPRLVGESSASTIILRREMTSNKISNSTARSSESVQDREMKTAAQRERDLKILGKQISTSSKKLAKLGNSIENKRARTQTRSTCKRQLFASDLKKETRKESSNAKTRKKANYISVNRKSRKDDAGFVSREIATRESEEETSTVSVRPLRSIEDIRKSIDNNELSERTTITVTKESRSAIANRCSVWRDGDAERSIRAAQNAFLVGDRARSIKAKSCISRITKSPSPDPAARKHETNTRAIRGSASSSLSKSPDIPSRRASTELKNQDAKPSRKSVTAKGADLTGGKGAGTFDAADGVANDSPHESATKKSSAFVIDFNGSSKEDDTMPSRKPPMRKTFSDKQQITPNTGRSSSSSNSSVSLSQVSSAKDKMISRARTSAGDLVACKTCGRHFAQDRVSLHQQICEKTLKKERKKFDTVLFRTRGTDLEPFVKKGFVKKQEAKSKKQSPTKPDWRRKHEEFISAIRYAKQAQAYQAAGKDLRDLPPPPPSDTSDYIQCPHCNRKFNQAAAERHIPKCKDMQHNKPRSLRTRR